MKTQKDYRDFLNKVPFDHFRLELKGLGIEDVWEAKVAKTALVERALVALQKLKDEKEAVAKKEIANKPNITKEILEKNLDNVKKNIANFPSEFTRDILVKKQEEIEKLIEEFEEPIIETKQIDVIVEEV